MTGLEIGLSGLSPRLLLKDASRAIEMIRDKLKKPYWDRILYIAEAFRYGLGVDEVYDITQIDHWFLEQIRDLIDTEMTIAKQKALPLEADTLFSWKRKGFSDRRLGELLDLSEAKLRPKTS